MFRMVPLPVAAQQGGKKSSPWFGILFDRVVLCRSMVLSTISRGPCPKYPPCRAAMGRWRAEGAAEGWRLPATREGELSCHWPSDSAHLVVALRPTPQPASIEGQGRGQWLASFSIGYRHKSAVDRAGHMTVSSLHFQSYQLAVGPLKTRRTWSFAALRGDILIDRWAI